MNLKKIIGFVTFVILFSNVVLAKSDTKLKIDLSKDVIFSTPFIKKSKTIKLLTKKRSVTYKIKTKKNGVGLSFDLKKPISIKNFDTFCIDIKASTTVCISRIVFINTKHKSFKHEPDNTINKHSKLIVADIKGIKNIENSGMIKRIYLDTWMPKYINKEYSVTISQMNFLTDDAMFKSFCEAVTKNVTYWRYYYNGGKSIKITNSGINNGPALVITGKEASKKTTYAGVNCPLPKTLDFTKLSKIVFSAKSQGKCVPHIKVQLLKRKGNIANWHFICKPGVNKFKKCVFPIEKTLKKMGDLSQVRYMQIGFGLWEMKKCKYAHKVVIDKLYFVMK